MKFPWREYSWCIVLIGLTIGLAVEQRRLLVFSAARDHAQQSERNAYELGRKICEPAGGQMLISHDTIFLPTARHGQWVTEIVNVPHVFETKEKDQSYLTGMEDLDFVLLLLLVLMPLSFGVGLLIRRITPAGGKAYAKFSVRNYYLSFAVCIIMCTTIAVTGFNDAKPFGGTLALCGGVLFLCGFLITPAVKLTAELSQKIDENYEKSPVDWQTLKAAIRLPLRDFFWLTIVIGLSALLVVEHKRTRALSEHPDRAEWWSRAERLLQEKHVELTAK